MIPFFSQKVGFNKPFLSMTKKPTPKTAKIMQKWYRDNVIFRMEKFPREFYSKTGQNGIFLFEISP